MTNQEGGEKSGLLVSAGNEEDRHFPGLEAGYNPKWRDMRLIIGIVEKCFLDQLANFGKARQLLIEGS